MTDLATRIVQSRKRKRLTQQQLADAMDIARVSVTNWESGKTAPDRERLPMLARVLGTTVEWLLEERGQETQSLPELTRVPLDEDNGNGWHDGWKASMPGSAAEIDVEGGAGEGSVGNVVQIETKGIRSGHLVVNEWVVPSKHLGRSPQGVVFIPIKGTSMLPVLTPTDVVAVDTTVDAIHNGEIYAIDEGGGPSVKRLYVNYEDDPVTVDIISENQSVGRKTRIAENVRVIGRVIGKWSKM